MPYELGDPVLVDGIVGVVDYINPDSGLVRATSLDGTWGFIMQKATQ